MPLMTQRSHDVMEIILDWPDVRNALGPDEGREVRLALETSMADDSLGAIVLSARGPAFCAGGNLPEILRLAEKSPESVRAAIYGEFQGLFRTLRHSPIPVVMAVDGPAIGFGCDLALAGSMTYIGASGWLAQGWMKAGLIPATGGALYVARRGGAQAVWRLLTTDRVDGPTAESWGLAIACTNARTAALEVAVKLAAMPRQPMRALTHLARLDEPDEHLQQALDYQVGFICDPHFAAFARTLLKR